MTKFTLEYNEILDDSGDTWAVWHVVVGGVAVSPGFSTEQAARDWAKEHI